MVQFLLLLLFALRISLFDIYWLTIPNRELFQFLVLTVLVLVKNFEAWNAYLVFMILIFGFLLSRFIGAGDIKLMAILSLWSRSPLNFMWSILYAGVLGGFWALGQKFRSKNGRNIPFAPALFVAWLIN